LQKYFDDIINVNFTAEMETKLDSIESGGKDWHKMIADFYENFAVELKKANTNYEKVSVPDQVSDVICEKCGAHMVVKDGKYGKFLACPNFPKCRNIKSLQQKSEQKPDAICPKCGKNVFKRYSKNGKLYYACEDYQNCKFMSWDLPINEKCPLCGEHLVKKFGKTADIIKCSNANCLYNRVEKHIEKSNKENDGDIEG
jgi:DNA topoisomerase-1